MSLDLSQLQIYQAQPTAQPELVVTFPVAGYKTIKTQAILDLLTALDAQIAALQAQRKEIANWLS